MGTRALVAAALAAVLVVVPSSLRAQLRSGVGWTVESVSIKGEGDSVRVSLGWRVSGTEVAPTRAVVLSPVLQHGNARVSLTPVSFYGRKTLSLSGGPVSGNVRERRFEDMVSGVTFLTEDVIPYREWMDTVSLAVSTYEWVKGSGLSTASFRQLGNYVKSPRPDDPDFPMPYEAPLAEEGQVGRFRIGAPAHFREDSALVDEAGMEGDSLFRSFAEELRAFTSSPKVTIRSGELRCYVPPEGTPAQSDILSRNRSNSVYEYLRSGGAFRYGRPSRVGRGEDWDGFRDWTASTWYGGDTRLMEILSGGYNDRERLSLIRREKPVFWEEADRLCRPSLSRVEYEAVFRRPVFTVAEMIRDYFQEVPGVLSALDFWRYASLYPEGSDYWLDVLMAGAYYHSDDVRLNRSVAACLTQRGAFGRAAVYLRNCGDDDMSVYAYALWLYGQGRYGETLEILQDLSYRSEFFERVWEKSAPMVRWYNNGAGWVRYYP